MSMEKIVIHQAAPAMLDEMAALEPLCFSDPWSRESLADSMQSSCDLWLCAFQDERLIGTFGAQILPPEAEILSVGVHPDFRRQGIARRLLAEFFTRAVQIERVYLEVRRSNCPAQALYAAFGFSACGVRKSYYEHPVEDAILMSWTKPKEELC